ncbi:hypothetical protein RFI_19186 [Reticulomyxa filosa]|uniref:Uncharacterized protein n=1 Tax=Reticulomyxa filosa TaxID=46433 RepID=X6MXA0_RETFI|nr:hypothetical protein RFI_19186 [Reticulomyxa filosa]|eukprot:ETO18107.1 hypothetical protein RFI_19186 [Reticulomyxa filosa]
MFIGLKKLVDYCEDSNALADVKDISPATSLERGRSGHEKYGTKVKLEIMRCKNSFNDLILPKTDNKPKPEEINLDEIVIPEPLPVPGGFRDIKFNVIVTMFEEGGEPMSIVGEIQILLKTMLDTKLKRHDLYEIQRIEEFYDKAKERMDYANLIHQLRVADLVDETERTDAYVEFFLTIQCLFFVLSLMLYF